MIMNSTNCSPDGKDEGQVNISSMNLDGLVNLTPLTNGDIPSSPPAALPTCNVEVADWKQDDRSAVSLSNNDENGIVDVDLDVDVNITSSEEVAMNAKPEQAAAQNNDTTVDVLASDPTIPDADDFDETRFDYVVRIQERLAIALGDNIYFVPLRNLGASQKSNAWDDFRRRISKQKFAFGGLLLMFLAIVFVPITKAIYRNKEQRLQLKAPTLSPSLPSIMSPGSSCVNEIQTASDLEAAFERSSIDLSGEATLIEICTDHIFVTESSALRAIELEPTSLNEDRFGFFISYRNIDLRCGIKSDRDPKGRCILEGVDGSGIFHLNNATLTLTGFTLKNGGSVNHSKGGSIYMSNTSTLNLTDMAFTNNKAVSGGAIFSDSSGSKSVTTRRLVTAPCIENSVNNASTVCGTIKNETEVRPNRIIMDGANSTRRSGTNYNVEFLRNMAWSGGAVDAFNTEITGRKIKCQENVATRFGGAFRFGNGTNSKITDSLFYNNYAGGDGGGLYTSVTGLATFDRTTFRRNAARLQSAAIDVTGEYIVRLLASKIFENNVNISRQTAFEAYDKMQKPEDYNIFGSLKNASAIRSLSPGGLFMNGTTFSDNVIYPQKDVAHLYIDANGTAECIDVFLCENRGLANTCYDENFCTNCNQDANATELPLGEGVCTLNETIPPVFVIEPTQSPEPMKQTVKPTANPTKVNVEKPTLIVSSVPVSSTPVSIEAPLNAPQVSTTPSIYPTQQPSLSPMTLSPEEPPFLPPTMAPTLSPVQIPTTTTFIPTNLPILFNTIAPIIEPTITISPPKAPIVPTKAPNNVPTKAPTNVSANAPTNVPANATTNVPANAPTNVPAKAPTNVPANAPTNVFANAPTKVPANAPTNVPAKAPTNVPAKAPTNVPANAPTDVPAKAPTNVPAKAPTNVPANAPTNVPANAPTNVPANAPTNVPSPAIVPIIIFTTPPFSLTTTPTVAQTDLPATIAPTITPRVTQTITPSVAPTPLPCFESTDELRQNVVEYLLNLNAPRRKYGEQIGSWCVDKITDFSYLFCTKDPGNGLFFNTAAVDFNEDISEWNTSSATDMKYIFFESTAFNQDLSTWDVSSVRDMTCLFCGTTSFNSNISTWDVSSVTKMESMFNGAKSFNQDISEWKVSLVTNMAFMFTNATLFNQDLSLWDVSAVTTMYAMFDACENFNGDVSTWDVSAVTDMTAMFRKAFLFDQNLASWDVSSVTTMQSIFEEVQSFNQDISSWVVSSVTDMQLMFKNAPLFNSDISSWDVSSVNSFNVMFNEAISFNQDLSSWNVSAALGLTVMFYGASVFKQDLCKWGVLLAGKDNVDVNAMFVNTECPKADETPDLFATPPGPFCYVCL